MAPPTIPVTFDDEAAERIDPSASVLRRNDLVMVVGRDFPRVGSLPNVLVGANGSVRVCFKNGARMGIREYVSNGYSCDGVGDASLDGGVVVPLNYSQLDVRPSNLIRVTGIASSRSFSPPSVVHLPDELRKAFGGDDLVPFGLKYCFSAPRHVFTVSVMIKAPGVKSSWGLSDVSSAKVAEMREALGKHYRHHVRLPDLPAFGPDADPELVFRTVNARFVDAVRQLEAILPTHPGAV